MEAVRENLEGWKESLVFNLPIAGLLSRNPEVYRNKAMFRVWLVREAALWRITELVEQSIMLYDQKQLLGARILLRSGVETFAALARLNILISDVLLGRSSFEEFSEETSNLALGSRDGSTQHNAKNIVTVLGKVEKLYPGIQRIYAALSEGAHPNFEGLVFMYSRVDHANYETNFESQWSSRYEEGFPSLLLSCMEIFHNEYNDVWPERLSALEDWVFSHKEELFPE